MRTVISIVVVFSIAFFAVVLLSWSQPRLHNSVNINACYKIRNGQLRLAAVSPDGTLFCRRNELPIQWPATCQCEP